MFKKIVLTSLLMMSCIEAKDFMQEDNDSDIEIVDIAKGTIIWCVFGSLLDCIPRLSWSGHYYCVFPFYTLSLGISSGVGRFSEQIYMNHYKKKYEAQSNKQQIKIRRKANLISWIMSLGTFAIVVSAQCMFS